MNVYVQAGTQLLMDLRIKEGYNGFGFITKAWSGIWQICASLFKLGFQSCFQGIKQSIIREEN